MNSPEQQQGGVENTGEVSTAASERAAELRSQPEKSVEHSPEQRAESVEKAKAEAHKEALMSGEAGKERSGSDPTSSARSVGKTSSLEKKHAYKQTMSHIRSEMSAPSRTFSKVIHAPFIEKSSEILGSSLARPNAVLAGSFTALVLVTLIYVVSRTFGYRLSGFETIGAFVLGWILGIIFDYVKVMATGKR